MSEMVFKSSLTIFLKIQFGTVCHYQNLMLAHSKLYDGILIVFFIVSSHLFPLGTCYHNIFIARNPLNISSSLFMILFYYIFTLYVHISKFRTQNNNEWFFSICIFIVRVFIVSKKETILGTIFIYAHFDFTRSGFKATILKKLIELAVSMFDHIE